MPQPTFPVRIKLGLNVPKTKAHALPVSSRLSECTWANGKRTYCSRGLQSENFNSCVGLGISYKEKDKTYNEMYHLAPELNRLNYFKQQLKERLEAIRANCEDKINVFVCGGWDRCGSNRDAADSFDLYNGIGEVCDEQIEKYGDIDLSMICGREKNSPLMNMYTTLKNIHYYGNGFKNIFKDVKNPSREEVINALEQTHETVEISPNHELMFIG